MKLLVSCMLLALFSILGTASAQLPDDIRKHFDEHIVGQWTGETTWGSQRITGQSTNAWDESGVAILCISNSVDEKGNVRSTETHVWDGASSEIVVHGFDTRGSVWTIRWKRASSQDTINWVGTGIGTYEGKRWESPTKIHCGKDEWRYEDTTDGKPFITVGKRKPSSSDNQPHLAWLKYLEGTWKCQEGEGNSGTVTFRATRPAQAIVFQVDIRDYTIAGVMGWNADAKQLVETDYFADRKGVVGSLDREYSEISQDSIKGQGKFRFSNGDRGSQQLEYRRISENEMTLTGSGGDGLGFQVTFNRVK